MSRRLLLLSNSRDAEGRYLAHAREALAAHLSGVETIAFVPFASVTLSWDDYTTMVRDALAPIGADVQSVHDADNATELLHSAGAIAIGGGNTFNLLAALQRTGLLDVIRGRAASGTPYVGWSAGSVVACPTIGTTNDMPIIAPSTLSALWLVRFQINAHFTDAHPPGFQGETRRQRLAEYTMVNRSIPVVGLPEGDWLEVHDERVTLRGAHPAHVFRHDTDDQVVHPGTEFGALLEPHHQA